METSVCCYNIILNPKTNIIHMNIVDFQKENIKGLSDQKQVQKIVRTLHMGFFACNNQVVESGRLHLSIEMIIRFAKALKTTSDDISGKITGFHSPPVFATSFYFCRFLMSNMFVCELILRHVIMRICSGLPGSLLSFL